MSKTGNLSAPSLADRVRTVDAGAVVVGAHFLGATPVFVLGEEAVLFLSAGEVRRIAIHSGAILASTADGARLVTGGDDGRLIAVAADGVHRVLARDGAGRWIDQVALGRGGAVAWSAGRVAHVLTAKGGERRFEAPSTVAGLAFAPKGFRLAVAHYNGATLWFPDAPGVPPEKLDWKGSHLAVSFSPDGRFLVTAMQEPTLHGWRLADRQPMRMSGYLTRVRSLSWTADGHFLATSGAERLVLWPFDGKAGPMGRAPRLISWGDTRIAMVACHPCRPVVAVGTVEGAIALVRIDDGAAIEARPAAASPVSALAWDGSGSQLAFGCENGEAGVVTL